METLLCLLLLVLILLIYLSGRKNAVNRWFALAGFLFWLGFFKEAVAYNLIPFLENAHIVRDMAAHFLPIYSLMTWALYTLAVPTAIQAALSFGGRFPSPVKRLFFYLPAVLSSFIYYPWQFHIYQAGDVAFWRTFACYNVLGCGVYGFLMVQALARETDMRARAQKRMVLCVMLPPVIFWALTAFVAHVFPLTFLDKLWQLNALVLLICVAIYIFGAFRGGMMGLRLTGESYRWNSDMGLIRRGASYTGHMVKNQTTKMMWCVDNLKAQLSAQGAEQPEELAILSRAIAALQGYTEKAARYADAITLSEDFHSLDDMLFDAFSLCVGAEGAPLVRTDTEGINWYCDRTHMTEVFVNLFTNALENLANPTPIEVQAIPGWGNAAFTLRLTDHGSGMPKEDAKRIFDPYFTTKSSPYNLGLGLAYCKSVITEHGGTLEARSAPGKGCTIFIRLPADRIQLSHAGAGREATRHG